MTTPPSIKKGGIDTPRRRLLLHVGYGKTGTSTLQRAIFDPLGHEGKIHYFGMFKTVSKDHPDRVFFDDLQAAMYLDADAFVSALPALKADFAACAAASFSDIPLVLSNEHFLLSSYSSRVAGATISAPETAQRLGLVFNAYDVALMIGLRRQDAFMRSVYIETAARAGHANHEHFQDFEAFIWRALDETDIFHSMLDYGRCITAYSTAFPDAQIHAYLFEDFKRDTAVVWPLVQDALALSPAEMKSLPDSLPHHNAKPKSQGGTNVVKRTKFETFMRRNYLVQKVINKLDSISRLKGLVENIRPKTVVRLLEDSEVRKIMSSLSDSNQQLNSRLPEISSQLRQHGYLSVTKHEKRDATNI